jgi:hypothetical protein
MKDINYGIKARAGRNHLAITGTYRLSNIFKNSYYLPEMPRFTVGVEIGIY